MRPPPSLLGTPRDWAIDLGVATAIGAFLGVIGPFGSFNGGPIEMRIAYWVADMWIGFITLTFAVRLSLRAARRLDLPIWFALALGAAVGSLPAGLSIALFSSWFWPGNHGAVSPFPVWYGESLAIAEPFSFAFYFLGGRLSSKPASVAAETVAPATAAGTGFLDRLPPRLGRDLLCLQMEDHYVRAHTALGSDLVLTPLKDAIAELADVDGLQVHRSWWVAKRAVGRSVLNGRNQVLRLSNGLDVPVSRASIAKLRAAGWLSD